MNNDANLPYRILEMAMPEGKTKYYLTLRAEAPFLDNQSLGAFNSVAEILEMWPDLVLAKPITPLVTKPALVPDPVMKSVHHQDRDYLWRNDSVEARASFNLPLDEFTERLDVGIATGPEALSLMDEMELTIKEDPEALELQYFEAQKDKLEVVRRGRKAGVPYIQVTVPLKMDVRWPDIYVVGGISYMRKYLLPQLSIGFLGIDSLTGTLC